MRWFIAVVGVVVFTVLAEAGSEAKTLPLGVLYCKGLIYVTDAPDVFFIDRARVQGRAFTAWVDYGWTGANDQAVPLSRNNALGYQLDNGPVESVHALVKEPKITLVLSLSGLSMGAHRLSLGNTDGAGGFITKNNYCFKVPGNDLWIRKNPGGVI
jgi:hypothetical protein